MPTPKPYRRSDGTTTWRVRFRHGGKNTSETFATEKAALAFCSDVTHHGVDYAVRMRDEDEAASTAPTLDEAAESFFEWKSTRVRSDRTIADYRAAYKRWISPTLGRRSIAGIEQDDVQALIDTMSAKTKGRKGLSPKSVAHHHALLHSIYTYATHPARAWVDHDPCAATDLPKRTKKPPKGLRPAEWQALHRALVKVDPDADDLALFLLYSGWRWSEAAGLSVWDVDLPADPLTQPVHVTMGRVLRRNAAGQYVVVEDAKSTAGHRRVALTGEAAIMVARRMVTAEPGGLLFTTKNGASWNYAHFRERAWNKAVKVANLPRVPTPHELRHTHVWWMVQSGASLPELQSRIGHASIKTTIDVYGRMVTDVSAASLTAFDALAAGPSHPGVDAGPGVRPALPPTRPPAPAGG